MLSIQVMFYSKQVVLLLCLLWFSFLACVQNEVLVVDNFIFTIWKATQYHQCHAKWVFAQYNA